jgi:PAS domain S-box-containing protein
MSSFKPLHSAENRLRQWLMPTTLSLNDSNLRLAAQVSAVCWLCVAVSVGHALLVLLFAPDRADSLRFTPLWLLSAVLPYLLVRAGRVRAAALAFMGGAWLAITLATIAVGGTRAPTFGLYALVVMLAALWVGWRAAVAFGVLAALTGFAMIVLDSYSLIAPPTATAASAWLTEVGVMLLLATATYLTVRRSEQALARVQQALAERQHMETALRESEARFRALVDNSTDMISIVNADGVITYQSPSVTPVNGYTPEQMVGQLAWNFVHPDDQPAVVALFAQEIQKPGSSSNIEYRLQRADQSWLYVESRGVNLLHDPVIRGVLVNTRDSSQRHHAEQALRESEKRYRAISELISDYAYAYNVDPDGSFRLDWMTTDSFQRMTGYTLGWESVNYTLYHPDDAPLAQQHVEQTLQGQVISGEYRIIARNGTLRWIQIQRRAEWDETHGRVIRFYGAATDITERKLADQALRESEAMFRAIFESAPYAITITNGGRYVDANPAFLQGVQMAREEVLGRTQDELGFGVGDPGYRARMVEKLRASGRVDNEEVTVLSPDGHTSVALYSSRVVEVNGAPHILTITVDISERKRAETQILALNAELQQQATHLRTLNDIARAVTTVTDMDSTLRRIMAQLADILSFDAFFVALCDQDTGDVHFPIVYDDGRFWQQPTGQLTRTSLAAQVLGTGQPALINRTPEQIAAASGKPSMVGNTSRISASIIMVPLRLSEQVIGVLSVQSYTLRSYSQSHVDLLMGAAYSVSIAIDNARLYDSLQYELEQRRQAEESARRSEVLLRALLDATTDIAFLMAPDGTFLTLNRTMASAVDHPIETLIGRNGFELLRPEVRASRTARFENARSTRLPERWIDQSGDTWWDNSLYPVLTEQGSIEAFALYSRNITQQKRLEAELQRYTAQLEQMVQERTAQLVSAKAQIEIILNSTSDAVALARPNGDILTRNPAFVALFGSHVSGYIERLLWVVADETQALEVGSALLRALNEGEAQRVEMQVALDDGSARDIELALIPVQLADADGQPGVLVSAHDITHLKEMERFKARFVADAVHDLATPITGLSTRLYLLKRAPEQLDEHVRALGNQVDHLGSLLTDLRMLSQIDRKRLPPELCPRDITPLVVRVFDTYEPVALSKAQTLRLITASALPLVPLDSQQIERVLVNLVSNAINYTPTGKTIVIQTALEDNHIVVSVADEGIGIAADELPRIFERFYRTDRARLAQSSGTGLGLAIVKEIVDLHSGSITVTSEPGLGSTFTVRLPLAQD